MALQAEYERLNPAELGRRIEEAEHRLRLHAADAYASEQGGQLNKAVNIRT